MSHNDARYLFSYLSLDKQLIVTFKIRLDMQNLEKPNSSMNLDYINS